MIKKLLDITFWKFILVGIANTLFGYAITFVFLNVFNLGYFISTASNYFFGSILSYFLNKHFTFKNKEKGPKVIIRFVISICICYAIAYGIAPYITDFIFKSMENDKLKENISVLFGMGLFVILNYLGQRFFAFKKED